MICDIYNNILKNDSIFFNFNILKIYKICHNYEKWIYNEDEKYPTHDKKKIGYGWLITARHKIILL